MSYPHISHGNAFKIQKRQHILTKRIISNFAYGGRVEVASVPSWKIEDKRFDWAGSWLHRRWSHKSERVACSYERGLHEKLDRAYKENKFRSHRLASEYFSIWVVKSDLANRVLPDIGINGVVGDPSIGRRDLEVLESKGMVAFPEENGRAVSRGIDRTHLEMMVSMDALMSSMKSVRWQLVVAPENSFVVPMSAPNSLIIPISHHMVLCGFEYGEKHKPVYLDDQDDIDRINLEVVRGEERWVVARSRSSLERLRDLL